MFVTACRCSLGPASALSDAYFVLSSFLCSVTRSAWGSPSQVVGQEILIGRNLSLTTASLRFHHSSWPGSSVLFCSRSFRFRPFAITSRGIEVLSRWASQASSKRSSFLRVLDQSSHLQFGGQSSAPRSVQCSIPPSYMSHLVHSPTQVRALLEFLFSFHCAQLHPRISVSVRLVTA